MKFKAHYAVIGPTHSSVRNYENLPVSSRGAAKTSNFSIESSELELETTNNESNIGASQPKPSTASLDEYFAHPRNPAKKRTDFTTKNSPFRHYGIVYIVFELNIVLNQ